MIEGAVVVEQPSKMEEQTTELNTVMDENVDALPDEQQQSASGEDIIDPLETSEGNDLTPPAAESPEDNDPDA